MAFIVEDGTIVPYANSYVSLANATAYFSVDVFEQNPWNTLTATVQQNMLIKATELLDSFYDYDGCKTVATSSLRWPRQGICDRDYNRVPNNIIPTAIQNAVCELAYTMITQDLSAQPSDQGIESINVAGAINIVFDKSDRIGFVPNKVKNWMRGYGWLVAGSRNIKIRLG